MKFLIILSLFYCSSIHADQSITIEISNVTGEFKVGDVPVPFSDPDITDEMQTESLKIVLELARRMAAVGVHELPPFDPYVGNSIATVEIEGLDKVKGNIDVSNLVITGLKDYEFSKVAVQSTNLSIPWAKLIKYTVAFQSLKVEGDVKATVSIGGGTNEVITATLSGLAEGVVRDVSIGLEPLVKAPWDLHTSYGVRGMNVESCFDKLKIKLTNVKTVSARSRAMMHDRLRDNDVIANVVTAVSSGAVKKQLQKILFGMTVEQLDAFLLPKFLDRA